MRPNRLAAVLLLLAALTASLAPPPAAGQSPDPADPAFWYAIAPDGTPRLKLYFFWTHRCEHCRAAKPFLESLPGKLPYVELVSLATEGDAANRRLRDTVSRALGADRTSVPAIFFCGQSQIGFDDAQGIGGAIERRLADCRTRLAADPALLVKPVAGVLPPEQRATDSGGPGTVVAIVVGVAFLGLLVAGVAMSRRAAADQSRARAVKQAEKGGGRRRRRRS